MIRLQSVEKIRDAVDKRAPEIVDFLRDSIKIPSPSGMEEDFANFVTEKMKSLGYANVTIDEMGNVHGRMKGKKSEKTILYNGHIDHVPPGDMSEPYSAKIRSGEEFGVQGEVIYGRGACDMKAGIVSMIMGGTIAHDLTGGLENDLLMTGVIMEDFTPGHPGPKFLIEKDGIKADYAIITESTNLELAIGHRGSALLRATFAGRSCHASRPEEGINALYHASIFVEKAKQIFGRFPAHPFLGSPSAAVTDIEASPGALNVIPDKAEVFIDLRYVPNYGIQQVMENLNEIILEMKKEDPRVSAKTELLERHAKTFTGYEMKVECVNRSFFTDPNENLVLRASDVIEQVKGSRKIMKWTFGTDGAYFSNLGIPTIGIGPGEERFAHTTQEHVRVEDLLTATKIYAALNLQLAGFQSF